MAENMSSYNNDTTVEDGRGAVKIATEVIATITGTAANEVEGVVGITGGISNGIDKLLGKRSYSKGIKISVADQSVVIDLDITVHYGCNIPAVATAVQEKVKESVETMTGLTVEMVNVHIEGVEFQEEPAPAQEESPQE
ncbi:MAG: Asp23/Gls24 family envelope stress response protein [Eubacteriales bacterium]|jgi:uncharacterized alkaline shock family protein YloU